MKRYLMILIAVLTVGVLLAGCGKFSIKGDDGEKININLKDIKDGKLDVDVEDKDGESSSFNVAADEEGSTEMSMDTEDGQFTSKTGENTELPDGFPEDFPIPDDVNIEMANTLTDEHHITYSIHFLFNGNAEDIYKAVKEYAEKKGMEINLDSQSEIDGQKSYMFNAGDPEKEYFSFSIGQFEEERANVSYSVME